MGYLLNVLVWSGPRVKSGTWEQDKEVLVLGLQVPLGKLCNKTKSKGISKPLR